MRKKSLWLEGLTDAIGFLGGAMMGLWLGRLLGLDLSAEGYGNSVMGAIVLVGIGGGLGLQFARHWRSRQGSNAEAGED